MDVADDVKRIIAGVLKIAPDRLKVETRLSELEADSLDRIEIVFGIEEKFDINIALEPRELSAVVKLGPDGTQEISFNTVGEIIKAVQQIVDAKAV